MTKEQLLSTAQSQSAILSRMEEKRQAIIGLDYIPIEWIEAIERYGKWKIVRVKGISNNT